VKVGKAWRIREEDLEAVRAAGLGYTLGYAGHVAEAMQDHWVHEMTDHGELYDAANNEPQDLFLVETREWHSYDGKTWEQLPTHWKLYTSGHTAAVDHFGTGQGFEELGQVLMQGRWALAEHSEPTVTVEAYSVDTARRRRFFAAATMPEGVGRA